ncbi:MAG TPA: hypothetical protein VIJ39_09325 [Solirubrobacteraceae bacterium]
MSKRDKPSPPLQRLFGLGHLVVVVSLTIAAMAALSVSAASAASHPPDVATGGVSNVNSSSAILYGAVNPHGQATNYVFQYGMTKGYGAQTSLTSVGNGTTTIKKLRQAIGGLQADTIYHYRILATSAAGATAGADHSFITPKIPLSLQIVGAPNPVPFGDPFALQGTLFGTAADGRAVALQANPFPYVAGFKTLGNPELTSSTGSFSFPIVSLSTNTQMRVVTTSAPFISSPVVVEGVAVRVSFYVQRVHRRRRGLFYRMYGTVSPAEVGAHIGFQLMRSGASSVNQGGAIIPSGTSAVSRFSAIVRVRHRGVYEALAQVFDGSHVPAYSAPIRIR